MILDALLGLLMSGVAFLFSVLPDAGVLPIDGFGEAISAFKAFDAGLPVTESLELARLCLGVVAGVFVARLLLTVWHAIPGKMT